jgi:hypothetical protein
MLNTYSGPLCNIPIAIPPDQDPNMRMEQHIEKECSVTTGKREKQGGMPVCARGKCGKVLFAPIKCNVSLCQNMRFCVTLIVVFPLVSCCVCRVVTSSIALHIDFHPRMLVLRRLRRLSPLWQQLARDFLQNGYQQRAQQRRLLPSVTWPPPSPPRR